MKKRVLIVVLSMIIACGIVLSACGREGNEDKYSRDGKLILNFACTANAGTEDELYGYISDKFQIAVEYTTIPWDNWETSVNKMMNGDNMKDMVNWDFRPQKYSTYKKWADGNLIKALPDDLSKYPNVQKAINDNPDIERFKINGKLYCFPCINTENGNTISDIRYIYRRDWAKKVGKYKEGDIYTLDEFTDLLRAIKDQNPGNSVGVIPLADVGWSTPSLSNYYQDELSSYVLNEAEGNYVWKYTTDEFDAALQKTRDLNAAGLYWKDFYSYINGGRNLTEYKAGKVGVTYDNFTLKNLVTLRDSFKTSNAGFTDEQVRDATAPLYLKRADNSFYTEELGYWWSVNIFSAGISDNKMNKFLELMDWYLSEEGLKYNSYGVKGLHWEENTDGTINYLTDYNTLTLNSKMLRYMVSTNNDVLSRDPIIKESDKIDYAAVQQFLHNQLNEGNLTLNSTSKVNWFTGKNKDIYGGFSQEAQAAVVSYIQGGDKNKWNDFNSKYKKNYESVLSEINAQK